MFRVRAYLPCGHTARQRSYADRTPSLRCRLSVTSLKRSRSSAAVTLSASTPHELENFPRFLSPASQCRARGTCLPSSRAEHAHSERIVPRSCTHTAVVLKREPSFNATVDNASHMSWPNYKILMFPTQGRSYSLPRQAIESETRTIRWASLARCALARGHKPHRVFRS